MLQTMDPKCLTENVFSLLDDRWALLTAGTPEDCNTMTVSWGGVGILWNKPVVTVYVRPQRHTHRFMEKSDCFTLTFFGEGERREALSLCGSKSGREMDKFSAAGLTVAVSADGVPYPGEGELVLVCRTLYRQEMEARCFLDEDIRRKNYPNEDYHTMYVGEIVEVLKGN